MTASAASVLLATQDFSVGYPGRPPFALQWSHAIGPGVTLLYGDTGSGKSTVLRALAGVEPDRLQGRLVLAGVDFHRDPAAYRQLVFLVDGSAQGEGDFDRLDVRAATAALCGASGFDAASWQSLIEAFSLTPHLHKALFMLSTGTRRKVWLAAALASGRPLVLLDEPTAALDAPSIKGLEDALCRVDSSGRQAVVVASAEREVGVPLVQTIELPVGTI